MFDLTFVRMHAQNYNMLWNRFERDSDHDDSMAGIKAAADYIVSVFCDPLESRGVCIPSVQDELEEAVEYARQYLAIRTEKSTHIWYKPHISKCTQLAKPVVVV